MKLLSVTSLEIPDVKVIRFARFPDKRGYFTEHFRSTDFETLDFMKGFKVQQANESCSQKGVIRGLHFQWNPHMGKLVRTVRGHMYDIVLDIRVGSPTFGKIIAHDMPCNGSEDYNEWIWVPPGFAHGNCYLDDTVIEYFCTGTYSPGCEAGINPLSSLDWSLCKPELKAVMDEYMADPSKMSPKDLNGFTLDQWVAKEESKQFFVSSESYILVTGGSGLLGKTLKKLNVANALYPSSTTFDIRNYERMEQFVFGRGIKTILHCAAYTNVPNAEKEVENVIDANIIGTSNIAKLCSRHGIRLVYVSTDYVFPGTTGNYKTTDPLMPINAYAWSKLGGECAVKLCPESLILRLSFGPDEFPYPKAFVDQWTSREPVSVMAKKVMDAALGKETGVVHLGCQRRTVYEYAKAVSPDKEIGEISIGDIKGVVLPRDTSLDV
jgi:dTDP-4-dehydrorhamnose 3,5-epimerase